MARGPRRGGGGPQGKPFPCIFCSRDVPGGANFCPHCSKRVVIHCSGCGSRRRMDYAACPSCGMKKDPTAPPMPKAKCKRCGTEVERDAKKCDGCGMLTAEFKRLCPSCKKEVEKKANKCPHCSHEFGVGISDYRGQIFTYVICEKRYGGCGRGSQVDDLMAELGYPLLFQTERGVKIRCFKDINKAVWTYKNYFERAPIDDAAAVVEKRLLASDEAPWKFETPEKALEFLHSFPCVKCGTHAWEIDVATGVLKYAMPKVAKTAKGIGIIGRWLWAAAQELEHMRRKKGG